MVNKCDKNLGKSKLLGLEFSHLWIGQEVRFEVVESCGIHVEARISFIVSFVLQAIIYFFDLALL